MTVHRIAWPGLVGVSNTMVVLIASYGLSFPTCHSVADVAVGSLLVVYIFVTADVGMEIYIPVPCTRDIRDAMLYTPSDLVIYTKERCI